MRLKIRNLFKSFGSLNVLRGADMDVEEGEIAVILGRSGVGKSVLLKLLTGLIPADSGSIEIDGEEIVGLTEKELTPFRKRFGMIFQSAGLLASISVGDNVALGLMETTNLSSAEIRKVVAEKLAMVGLEGREGQEPSTLSGGQRKRVAIARALCMKSDCFLLDEPTAGLDPPMASTVDDIVQDINRDTGATCILVTHDLVSAFRLGHRIHMIHEGKFHLSATPAEFRQSEDPVIREFIARELALAEQMSSTDIPRMP